MITVQQYFAELTHAVGCGICRYTPSLFTDANAKNAKRPSSKREPIASSVLFQFDDRHFLVSAAHVFKRHDFRTIGLCNNKSFHRLDGDLRFTEPGVVDEDKIDIAIFELRSDFVNILPDCFQFYDLKSFNVDHADSSAMQYLFVGSPITRYKLKLKSDIQFIQHEPFIFRTHRLESRSTMHHVGAHDHSHIIFNYTRKFVQKTDDLKYITGPSLNGMSGSGIWKISEIGSQLNFADVKFFPTAILTEYEPKYHCVLGTRMRVVTEIMRQCFNVPIRKSTLLDLPFKTPAKPQ